MKAFGWADNVSSPIIIAWESDNKSLSYLTANGLVHSLWHQSRDNDKPYLIGDFGNEEIEALEMVPDGSSLGFIRGRWIHEAVLIEGLTELRFENLETTI